jgi:hypothetical protein
MKPIRRDSDLFLEGTQSPEFQERTQAAMNRGGQTRDAEINLARMVADLDEHGTNQADHHA